MEEFLSSLTTMVSSMAGTATSSSIPMARDRSSTPGMNQCYHRPQRGFHVFPGIADLCGFYVWLISSQSIYLLCAGREPAAHWMS